MIEMKLRRSQERKEDVIKKNIVFVLFCELFSSNYRVEILQRQFSAEDKLEIGVGFQFICMQK